MCELDVHCTHVERAHYLASEVGPDEYSATSKSFV